MRLFKTVPYRFAPVDASESAASPEFVYIVKGTFSFEPGQMALPAAEDDQVELGGDKPYLDEIGRSLRYSTDLFAYKPWGEITLTADCCVLGGGESREEMVWFEAGPIRKELVVTGDRVWVHGADGGGVIDGPMPFSRMPLRWERAFGGLDHPENPLGRGMDIAPDFDGKMRLYLPNIEHPGRRVARREDRPDPVGFAPISPQAASRVALQGTRDQRWAVFRAPLPPLNYDPCAEQAAPKDQWLDGYWQGDELIRLGRMDPVHGVIETRLPQRRPRLFVDLNRPGTPRRFVEIPIVLDTVHVDVAERRLLLTWRRAIRLESRDASEVESIYLTEESTTAERRSTADHYADFLELRGPDPEPRELQLERSEAAAVAEARKVLAANFDPALLKAFDEAKTSQARLDLILDLVRSKTTELEAMTKMLRAS